MYLCYLDESGSPEIGKDTSHFVFLGLAIPATRWKTKDGEVDAIKRKYGLASTELHAAWMGRRYAEQEKIAGFEKLDWPARTKAVRQARDETLVRRAAVHGPETVKNLRRTFRQTDAYTHLTHAERQQCLREVAVLIGTWNDSELFADAIDKTSFGTVTPKYPPFEEAFSQVVSRFHQFLNYRGGERDYGLLVQDNNPTAAKRLTQLMRFFHKSGTLFTDIRRIVETPLFVESSLTSAVQLADLCAYATRRFFENGEIHLFDCIYPLFGRMGMRLIGLRHYTGARVCACKVCIAHRQPPSMPSRRPPIRSRHGKRR